MAYEARLDPPALDTILAALLEEHPDAHVVAIGDDGFFLPMPASVPLGPRHRVLTGLSTALDLIVPEQHAELADVWQRVRATGASNMVARPLADPEQSTRLHFMDMRHRHGVYLGFMTGFHGTQNRPGLEDVGVAPRLSVIRKDPAAVILEVDDAACRILGWSAEELVGRRTLELLHPDDHSRAISSWMEMLSRPGVSGRVRLRHRHRDGHWIWLEITNHNLVNNPEHGYVVAEMVDITDEMAALEALRAGEQLLRRLTEALPLGVVQIDPQRQVIYQNAQMATIVGCATGDRLDVAQLMIVMPADRPALAGAFDGVLRDGRDADIECGYDHPDRGPGRCNISMRALTSSDGEVTGAVICMSDVTEAVQLREELTYQANFDALTNCRNRASTLAAVEESLREDPHGTAVVFLDLDQFKPINDRLGHAAGDQMLIIAAERLRRVSRGTDLVGRLGGDEFVVVTSQVRTLEEARRIGERIADEFNGGLIRLGTKRVPLRASVGVAWSGTTPHDADALLAAADAAMYEAKKRRDGRPALAEAS